jgi:flagellar hook assembly protein FlgD
VVAAVSMQVAPNPFTDHSRITFGSPVAESATLQVYSATGRLLRTLDANDLSDGTTSWDGRDDSGRPLATGVYWIRRLDPRASGGTLAQQKVVKLK